MKLSIIVPIYNVEAYLFKCLDSLLLQDISLDDYEIIAVNDGSTDNSLTVLEEYVAKCRNIKIITQKNQGLSGARNTGINHAIGKYLFFVDSDDYIGANCLKGLLQFAEENDLDALRFDYRRVYENGKIAEIENLTLPDGKIKTGKKFLSDDLGYLCYVWTYLFKTEVIKQHNLLFKTGIYFEDVEWLPRVLLQINKIGYFNRLVYNYLQRVGSITLSIDVQKKEKLLQDKLTVIDSVLAIKDSCADKGITRWSKKILSLSTVSLISIVIHNFYPKRKHYINELRCRNLFPLSFYSTKKVKFIWRVALLNISPALYCWIIGKRWRNHKKKL